MTIQEADPTMADVLTLLDRSGAGIGPDYGGVLVADVPTGSLQQVVHGIAADPRVRLADLFAADGDAVHLHLVWAYDSAHRYLVLRSPVSHGDYPSLTDVAPAAFYEECEIYEQFGIRPAGGRPLNRVALPPHAGPDFPRLGHPPKVEPAEVHAPHTVGGAAFEFPFGPVRATGMESLYFGLVTSGEEIVDLYLFTWHKHRGAEWRLRGQTPEQAIFHVERLEGLCAAGNAIAFARAVEAARGIRVGPQVERDRAVILELERLYNHANAVVALCQSCGLSVGQAGAEIALEGLLRLNAAVLGHRYLFGTVGIGESRRSPDIVRLRTLLPPAYEQLRRTADALMRTNSFLDRLEATGIVTAGDASRLGVVGPLARAAGLDIDTRRDHPAGGVDHPLLDLLRIPTGRAGDCLARLEVMLTEVDTSVGLLFALAKLGEDDRSHPDHEACGSGDIRHGLGWAETARGEALVWVSLDESGQIERLRLRPASARNWRAFDDAARAGNVFTDVPIIEASFWLTVAGVAR